MRVRVVPSILAFAERTGSVPPRLTFGFAAYLAAIRAASTADLGSAISLGVDAEGERIRSFWLGASDGDASLPGVVQEVCRDTELWHADLSQVPDFAGRVAEDLRQIVSGGTLAALASRATGGAAHAAAAPALSSKT
jgi:tagaturonate reductase